MKFKKKAILFLFILVLLTNFVSAVTDEDIRVALKKVLHEYFQDPGTAALSIVEINDLIDLYLTTPEGTSDVDLNETMQTIYDKTTTITITIPKCSDGTEYGECSTINIPNYCFNGNIIAKCSICGCPGGKSCQENGVCLTNTSTCTDGTAINGCSMTKPLLCNLSLSLVNDCTACGCPIDQVCKGDGSCQEYTSKFTINVTNPNSGRKINKELFGINFNWLDAGGGTFEHGDLLHDRSFRNQEPSTRKWINAPNIDIGGQIEYIAIGGDENPWGGKGYEGYLSLSQDIAGFSCTSQQLFDAVKAGLPYTLHLSAKKVVGEPALSVFFTDENLMPIESLNFAAIATSQWTDYEFTLNPTTDQDKGFLRICIVTAGTIDIDEVRLHQNGQLKIKQDAKEKIIELGIQSMRWPSGLDADYFDWKQSIGELRYRGETATLFGIYQTPSFGLHEFLDLTEELGVTPLITVNILNSSKNAADLLEYILGDSSTTMGTLRTQNGRQSPWNVKHFELGNEPVGIYKEGYVEDQAAKGYVELSKQIAVAMRQKANELGKDIELQGVLETTFASADWISLVPMLANWNDIVLDSGSGILSDVDHVKGHFYSGFTWKASEQELYNEIIAGGATLRRTIENLRSNYLNLPSFWLNEYSSVVEDEQIIIEYAQNYQSGLAVADILVTAIEMDFAAAHLFNLAASDDWGVLANNIDFRLRPAGLAFSLLSPLKESYVLPVEGTSVEVHYGSSGDGNNPADIEYPLVSAVAGYNGNKVSVVILNRNYATDEDVLIDFEDYSPTTARIYRYGPFELYEHNDDVENTVFIQETIESLTGPHVISVPARSLVRIDYS